MREELDKKLCEKYPKIFRDRFADMRTTAMCWGFECGDGWYNILDSLCWCIQSHIDWKRKQRARTLKMNRKIKKAIEMNSIDPIIGLHQGNWWAERCEEILKEKKYEEVPDKVYQVVATQVKEKFGGLRFYYGGGDETVRGMVHMAESLAAVTCEKCGSPGHIRGRGWLYAACDEHTKEGDKENEDAEDGNIEA